MSILMSILSSDGYIILNKYVMKESIYYKERLRELDGMWLPMKLLQIYGVTFQLKAWQKEGGVDFPRGKKPEKLIKRCIELTSNPGDLVLDSFLGSGTTAAVAHKMGRRYIGIELGDHCYTHCLPRLHC